MLPVGKVDEAVSALEGHKGPVELRHHVQQGGHGGSNGPQVLHGLRCGHLEALAQLLQLLFTSFPQSLGPLLQGLVAVASLGLGALKGHLLQGLGQLVPALGLLHPLQAVNGGTQGASIVVPQNGVLLQLLQHPLEGVGPILGQLLGIGEEQLAPGGVLRGGLPGQIKVRLALHEPVQGTGLALHLGVDIQNHRLQGLVVPVPGHAVGQGLEAGIVLDVGVPPLQHRLQGLTA